MPTFIVHLSAEASQSITVEADDMDQAIDIAHGQNTLNTLAANRFDLGDPWCSGVEDEARELIYKGDNQ